MASFHSELPWRVEDELMMSRQGAPMQRGEGELWLQELRSSPDRIVSREPIGVDTTTPDLRGEMAETC